MQLLYVIIPLLLRKKKFIFLSLIFFTPHFLKRRDVSSWRRISCGKATQPLPMLVKSLKEEAAAFSMTTTTTTMLVVARRLVQHHHHQRPRRYASSFYMGILFWCDDDFCAFCVPLFGVSPLFLSFGHYATLVRLLSLFLSLSNDDDDVNDAWWNDNRHR